MARIGSFDKYDLPLGWFSDVAIKEGWFTEELITSGFAVPEQLDQHRSGHPEPHRLVSF